MNQCLTDRESELSLTIVHWLADEMISRLCHDTPSSDLLLDYAQSNFEMGCSALATVGILTPEGHYWRVVKTSLVDLELPASFYRKELDILLDALACHSFYVEDLCRHSDIVAPSTPDLKQVCDAMVHCGYMSRLPQNTYQWTENMAPWLVRHGKWHLIDFELAPDAEIDAALDKMPSELMERLAGETFQPEFVRHLFARWTGDGWSDQIEWCNIPHDDWDLLLAAGLYIRLHGDGETL